MAKKLSRREEKLAAIRKADRDRDSEFDNLTFEEGRGAIKTREKELVNTKEIEKELEICLTLK